MSTAVKPVPTFASDAEAEKFVGNADLSAYDLSGFKLMHFEIAFEEAARPTRSVGKKLAR